MNEHSWSAMTSSERHDWETPPDFFAELDAEFHFEIDVCALPHNAKCATFYAPQDDGLRQPWAPSVCWMNPPYGREIGAWVEKAAAEAREGALVVGLLPARTDTRWFHEHVLGRAELRFIRGRIRFVGAPHSAPFPSLVAVWQCPGNVPEKTDQERGEAPRSIACIGAAGSPARRAKYV